jgi:quercetin dioxygenase-like cupin family protein
MEPTNPYEIALEDIEEKEIIKGFKAKFIHTEQNTLAFWQVEKGAVLPMHSHIQEQVTQVLEGAFELTINEITKVYKKGTIAVIPSNIMHGGVAITNCIIFDIFNPVREDYK